MWREWCGEGQRGPKREPHGNSELMVLVPPDGTKDEPAKDQIMEGIESQGWICHGGDEGASSILKGGFCTCFGDSPHS